MDPNLSGNANGNTAVRTGGPLSRTWPQLFKKRRRASPVRDAIEENQLQGTAPPLKIALPKARTASISVTPDNASTSTGSTQAEMLAQKSNYEWIAEGRHAEMGLHFSTAMATGVMMRRATHRAAEQARRDRMKTAMVDLAEYVLDGEVTFGSGTSCFVVSREEAAEEREETAAGGKEKGKKGKNINKARIIELALEKLKSQEKELALMEERLRGCECNNRMDTTE